jgi:hypothetical protein
MIHHFILTYDSQTKQFTRDECLEQDIFSYGIVLDPDEMVGRSATYHPHELSEHESVQHDLAAQIVRSYIALENTSNPLVNSLKQSIFDWAEETQEGNQHD